MHSSNKALFKALLDNTSFKSLVVKLRSIDCEVENIMASLMKPIYINCPLDDRIEVPFICINAPSDMKNGELSLWLGVDENDSVHSVSLSDFSSPQVLAKFIKGATLSESEKIALFCEHAYALKTLVDEMNNQSA